MFKELLTSKTFDEQLSDPQSRALVAERDGGERLVLRIGDDFVRAMAPGDPARLEELADPWSKIEEFHGQAEPDTLLGFLIGSGSASGDT